MATRSYEQFCPIAYSLDFLGSRWTLLIVRDLIYGPRRFSDLQRGLPGLGANLLSRRLKELQAAGLVRKRTLPPPAASSVYELTTRGMGLKDLLKRLTVFGFRYLQMPPPDGHYFGISPVMSAFENLVRRRGEEGLPEVAEFHIGDEVFHVAVLEDGLHVQYGPEQASNLVVHTDPQTLMSLLLGLQTSDEAVSGGNLRLARGDSEMLGKFFRRWA